MRVIGLPEGCQHENGDRTEMNPSECIRRNQRHRIVSNKPVIMKAKAIA